MKVIDDWGFYQDDYYYVRDQEYYDPIERAAQFLYVSMQSYGKLMQGYAHAQQFYDRAKKLKIDELDVRRKYLYNSIQKAHGKIQNVEFTNVSYELLEIGDFWYLDPPYYSADQNLYKYPFNKSKHEALARFLKSAKFKWLLSYDNDPWIRELYSGFDIQEIKFKYRINYDLDKSELLIANYATPKQTQLM